MQLSFRVYVLAAILSANATLLFAQGGEWFLWTGLDAEKGLSEKWKITLGAQYRRKDNMTETDQFRGSVDFSRTLGQYVQLGAGYELIAKHRTRQDVYVYRNRFRVQSRVQYKYDRFTADWRFRTQLTMMEKDDLSGGFTFDDEYHRWVFRNRFRLRYNIRKSPFRPYVSFELFHQPFSDLENSYFRNRLTIGTVYRINRSHNIEADYKLETNRNNSNSSKDHIIKIGYSYSF